MKNSTLLSVYQREFISRIIAIPSVGGLPEEGAPYGRIPREVLRAFLDEAKAKGFRTGVEGERIGWVEFGEGDRFFGILCHLDVVPVGDGWDADHDAVIRNLTEKASEYGLETQVTLDLPPLLKDRNSSGIRILTEIWKRHMDRFTGFREEYRDLHTEPKVVGVGTYARHIPNAIAFGIQAPWQADQCHQANEHVAVTDYMQWIQIMKESITAAGEFI